MIQDIAPHKFDNSFHSGPAKKEDIALCFRQNSVLLKDGGLPRFADLPEELAKKMAQEAERLFSIDETAFYLLDAQQLHMEELRASISPVGASGAETAQAKPEGFAWESTRIFRKLTPSFLAFGGITACHLWRWEQSRQYCGRCGTKTEHSKSERALFCPKCGLIEYPKISPAVIVAISDGDKLLMAKNANSKSGSYALIAGFVEIGESFEQTVHREAMEEVGIRLKNVRYYKSQPWGFSDTVMIGFTAELDGSGELTLQQSEIEDAKWVPREEIAPVESFISIGGELIENFRLGKI